MRLFDPCQRCGGSGMIPNPVWDAWWAANKGRPAKERDPLPNEPEALECPDCEGRGANPTPEGEHLLAFLGRFADTLLSRRRRHD